MELSDIELYYFYFFISLFIYKCKYVIFTEKVMGEIYMEPCSNCGQVRSGDEKFCVNCGHKFIESIKNEDSNTKEKATPAKSLPPKKKKRRVLLISFIALIVIASIGTHLYLTSLYDSSKTLASMNQAYSASEKERFMDHFTTPENTSKNAEGFYAYIEEEGWESLREQMKEEANRLESDGVSNIISDSEGNKLIAVLSEPVLWGLYEKVTFLIQPVEVVVEMPFNGTELAIVDQTISGDEGEVVELGKVAPGTYSWTANVKSDYAKVEEVSEVSIVGDGKNKFKYSPSIDVAMVEITSDLPEAVLWVNGKSTKKTISEVKSIGPLPLDGSVEITAEGKNEEGKKVKGEPMALEDDSVHIKFAHVQEQVAAEKTKKLQEKKKSELKDEHATAVSYFIDSFRDDFESALNYEQFSYIADYFPTGSKIQNDYLKDIERHQAMDNYYMYDFQSNTTTAFKVIDETTFLLTTAEMFYFSSEDDYLRYNKTKNYTVIFQHGQYFIQAIEQLTSDQTPV